ncbi:MAG: HEPN domain-containing protein [Candidatus Marsarchaeota archaeon]|nr:HEPN domain-containing protein [Candidatus Marsarchaeota archaeon]MCL5106142.1 HEPN domain-containing protein [Candidatus Marsarchaeota archaeon]
MEYKGIARNAIEGAKRWLISAELNAEHGSYDSALYSLEMSVEIAMKAVLLSIGIDVPKAHGIGDVFAASVRSDKRIPEEFKQQAAKTVEIFNALLGLRAASGYMFETNAKMEEFKAKYGLYRKSAGNAVELCSTAVHAAEHGKAPK